MPRTWTLAMVEALGVHTDLVTAASILGIGRTKAYDLAQSGQFPTTVLKVGRNYVVPVRPLLALLLGDAPAASADTDDCAQSGSP